jgi:hypothetical protein
LIPLLTPLKSRRTVPLTTLEASIILAKLVKNK